MVGKEWPCWLLVALAWGLLVAAVYIPTRFHPLFSHWVGNVVVWRSLKEWSEMTKWP
jgi:hypothetical protein